MHEFSSRGEPVTDFERDLVARCAMEFPESMSDLWVVIARRIGVEALVVVLDEIGREKIHVPSREQFFAALYRPVRDRQVCELAMHASLREVGERFGLSQQAVNKIVRKASADDGQRANMVRARP